MWRVRPETAADRAAIRELHLAAFRTSTEADLVDALRHDPEAWIHGLSVVVSTADHQVVGHALLTRCYVDHAAALALAPCGVLPSHQRQGAGTAAVRAALDTAKGLQENLVVVLGHPEFYRRLGFRPASRLQVRAPMEVSDASWMALLLHPGWEAPRGLVRYPAAFGLPTPGHG